MVHFYRYTDYEVYGDDRIVQTAQTKSRYSLESLFGIIFDVQMLAESDYFACTFSSNVSPHTACFAEIALPGEVTCGSSIQLY